MMNKIAQFAYDIRNSLNKPGSHSYVDKKVTGAYIPKVIHQTYHSKDLPIGIIQNIEKIKKENPDWAHKLYDDADIDAYIGLHFPQLLPIYKKLNPNYGAAKADFFRYLVIYNEGGVYLDIKSGLTKPLDEIIAKDDTYLLSHWTPKELGVYAGISNPDGELQQWHIIAVAGHPFLKAVINNVCHNIFKYNPLLHDFGFWAVLNTTGPIAYTEAIYPLLSRFPHRRVFNQADIGLVYSVLNAGGSFGAHAAIGNKKHYSKVEEPLVIQSMPMHLLFCITKPMIKFLKKKLKSSISR